MFERNPPAVVVAVVRAVVVILKAELPADADDDAVAESPPTDTTGCGVETLTAVVACSAMLLS
jgi:hypothetical protein